MKTIMIDPGHGGLDPGAEYNGYKEKDFNLNISFKVRSYLLQNYVVDLLMTRTSDKTVSLSTRSNLANSQNVDYFCSIHINAAGGSGFESFIYNGPVTKDTIDIRAIIHENIMNVIGQKYNVNDRGMKRANFHVLRETKMPAILIETLFIDNESDLKLLLNPNFIEDFSVAVAEGLAKALQLPRKSPSQDPDGLFKVIAGSFKERSNAEQRVNELKLKQIDAFINSTMMNGDVFYRVQAGAFQNREAAEKRVEQLKQIGINAFILSPFEESELWKVIAGSFKERSNAEDQVNLLKSNLIDAFIVSTVINDEVFYRVQAGAFQSRESAEKRIEQLKQIGINDAFILLPSTQNEENDQEPSPPKSGHPTKDITIQGHSILSGYLLDHFVQTVNPNAPKLGDYYTDLAKAYQIRGDIAFAQAIHETDYFRFTGIVKQEQNNYAGIGATGPNEPGASFKTEKDGVLAHLQHLYAYASTNPLPNVYPLVDPRFNLVPRGSAKTWKELNGKWAVPGDNYGQLILKIYKKMIDFSKGKLTDHKEEIKKLLGS